MKHDITQILTRAIEASGHWSPARAGEVLECVSASLSEARLDWDLDAGETWGRLLVKRQSVIALSSLVPVALLRTPVDAGVLGILERSGVLAIPTPDWEQREFRADPEVVKQAFRISEWSRALDPDGFSASELWWMTV